MKFEKIVGFGDSWMYGDELLDPDLAIKEPDAHACWYQNDDYRARHNFLGLLGDHYDVPVENYGIPGGSLQSSIWTFLWWLEHRSKVENCLILVGLTSSNRFSHYDPAHIHYNNDPPWNKFVHSAWVEYGSDMVPEDFRDLCKSQIALTACPELDQYNYSQAVLFFDGISSRHDIPLLQFNIMAPCSLPVEVPSLLWSNDWLDRRFWNHPELVKPNKHPNEKGHKLIRDMLIPEIDRVIMSE